MGSKRSSRAGPSVTLRKRLAQIEACEKSGESLKAYARRHALTATSPTNISTAVPGSGTAERAKTLFMSNGLPAP